MAGVSVRTERAGDEDAITRVTELAFEDHPHSDQTEPFVIQALRRAGALTLSLVAESEGEVVGHVSFSRVELSGCAGEWYGLGPVSVLPALQRRGVGTMLITEGLDRLRASGATGCVVVGDPAYYGRFGFESRPDSWYEGLPPEYFQTLGFGDERAVGRVRYHAAFEAEDST